jgi:hypothetical protein
LQLKGEATLVVTACGRWSKSNLSTVIPPPYALPCAALAPTPTAGVVTFSGLYEKPSLVEVKIKSGGNTFGGKAIVVTMSIASLSTNTVPTISDIATTKVYADYHSAKTAANRQRSRLSTLPTALSSG